MRARGTPSGEEGWTVTEVLLVLLFLGLLLALAVPNLLAARLRNDESAALRTMRELVAAQEMVRRAGLIDEDRDGKGEYALLGEISGERNPRTYAPTGRSGPTAPLPQFRLHRLEDGTAEVCGYRFRVLLPGAGGVAAEEDPDPALAARVWCAYAWPVRREGTVPPPTGGRTFFANQAGEVLSCEGDYAAAPPGENAPPREPGPGAAFAAPGPLETITGAPAVGTRGRDGNLWRAVK